MSRPAAGVVRKAEGDVSGMNRVPKLLYRPTQRDWNERNYERDEDVQDTPLI
jgi:hypothetical protein